MGDDLNYDYKTWEDVFEQISYCYERQYPVRTGTFNKVEYVTIYKGTFTSNGEFEYKGNVATFDPALWPKIKLFGKLFETNGTVDILYGDVK